MKTFLHSFYGKLSLLFLFLLLLLGAAQVWVTLRASQAFQAETDQRLNMSLASDLVPDFEPFLQDSIHLGKLKNMFHYMMVINPRIEIYLLSESGEVLAFFTEPGKKVLRQYIDVQPLQAFRSGEYSSPLLGADPRHPSRLKPFSAAPIRIGEQQGFLYVIIGGELFDSAAGEARAAYIKDAIIRGLLFTLFGAGAIGLLLFFLLTRRLRRLTAVVHQFEQGDLEQRLVVNGSDELAHFSGAFNTMANTIVANIEELRKTDALRRELVANVSHDLRSPLASIKGYLETILMKEGKLAPKEQRRYLQVILNTTSTLERLVDQLFELSKLDALQTKPQLEPFAPADLIHDIVMKFQPVAQEKDVSLQVDMPERLPQVLGDIGLLERAISNLLENAIRYTPPAGIVKVCLENVEERVRISISDTGCGIDQQELPHIFDRFYRVEKSRARSTGGTGLGLAITKKILDLHSCVLTVESTREVGSSFSFDLAILQGHLFSVN